MTITRPASSDTRAAEATNRRLARAKAAYTTRYAARFLSDDPRGYSLVTDAAPRAGDVVLARVEEIGQHPKLRLPDGRPATLFVGDEILVAYGNRYAPDQFEAEVPEDLDSADLVAAGGVASRVRSAHATMLEPTRLRPVGLLADSHGRRVNLARVAPFTPRDTAVPPGVPPVVAVLGTSMNSGKTTTVAATVRGLAAAGLDVAVAKVTGTGAPGDPMLFRDSHAATVLDFTDLGHASTYLLPHDEVRRLFLSLVNELAATRPDVIVLEIADGLVQRETAALIADPVFAEVVDHVVFAASDALGAAGALTRLDALGLAPAAISGVLTASPMAIRETRELTRLPVLSLEDLERPSVLDDLAAGGGRRSS